MTRGAGQNGRRATGPQGASRGMGRGLAAVAGVAVIGLLGWWWLSDGEDLVDETLVLERRLLDGDATGRDGRRTVDAIIRNVDRMSPDEVREVQRTLETEWREARDEDVEAYFAAQPDERRSILDRSIDRTLVYKELRFAVNPRARGFEGRRPRKPRAPAKDAAAAGPGDAAQRQLLERYDEALRQRARERRIDLPAWQ